MSNLDDELAKAIRDSEKQAPRETGEGVAPGVSRAPAPPPNRNVGLLISLLVMGTAVIALVMMVLGGKEEATYARTPGQIATNREELTASKKSLRVQGNLVSGTLRKRDQPCEYRFSIEGGGGALEVHYPVCIVPDTFRDVKGMPTEVTAEGSLSADGHLDAKNVLAKCPSKYDMDQMKASGRQMEQVPIRTVPDFENN
jgi:cytochrome c-type biogenesis protein CcmE